jgi:hypothetical protein
MGLRSNMGPVLADYNPSSVGKVGLMSSFKWSYTETHCSEPPRPQLVYICSYDIFIVFHIPLLHLVSGYLMGYITHLRTLTNLMALMARGSCQGFAASFWVLPTETACFNNRDSCHSQTPYNPQYSALVALIIKETYGIGSVKCWMLKIGNNHQFLSCQCFFHVFSTMLSHQLQMYGIFTRR